MQVTQRADQALTTNSVFQRKKTSGKLQRSQQLTHTEGAASLVLGIKMQKRGDGRNRAPALRMCRARVLGIAASYVWGPLVSAGTSPAPAEHPGSRTGHQPNPLPCFPSPLYFMLPKISFQGLMMCALPADGKISFFKGLKWP